MLNQFSRTLILSIRQRNNRHILIGILGVLLFLLTGLLTPPLTAQTSSINQARVAEILDSDQVFIQSNKARLNDLANRGQRVTTGSARAQLNFNTGAVARLSANSVLTVGQCAQLQRGVLLVNGAANGCTASVTAGVRGTTYLLEVTEDGQEQVKVLEGEVVVARKPTPVPQADETTAEPDVAIAQPNDEALTPEDSLSNSNGPEDRSDQVVLTAGQKVETRQGEALGPVQQLTAQDFIDILTGQLIEGFVEQLPGIDRIRNSFQQLFPSVPFPLSAPSIPVPRPRIPFF